MIEIPVFTQWVDMILICLIYSIITKTVQHIFINPKEYIETRLKSKKIAKDMRELAKQNDLDAVNKKQKESMELMSKQMTSTLKPMMVLMIIALPLLYIIKKYYIQLTYNFGLFSVSGLWAYIIIAMIISIMITNIYDKYMEKKYKSEINLN